MKTLQEHLNNLETELKELEGKSSTEARLRRLEIETEIELTKEKLSKVKNKKAALNQYDMFL